MTTPIIKTFILGDYQTNCFVITVPGRPECWIVDCGFEPDEMLDWIVDQNLKPIAILLTHSHPDHIAGVDRAISKFGKLPIYIHESEKGFCADPMLNLSAAMGAIITCSEPDHYLAGDEIIELNGSQWRVVHTPGHSPGGVCFIHDESNQAIVGDTIFAGSIGRMDFPTSDPVQFRHSILEVMMNLPDDLTIHPGHGPKTTIAQERRANPFIVNGF